MEKINFKPLMPQQIEVRPANTKFRGSANLLLYIDSRCAANILNEAVGEFNWQIEYKPINEKVYGRLSIWDVDKNQWVYKEDTGAVSNIEAEKGQASDILKRCIARWGCDYLYTAPDIKIKCPDNYYYEDKMTMKFTVSEIDYKDKKISRLVIVDRFNNVVFNWSDNTTKHPIQQAVNTAMEVAEEASAIATITNNELIAQSHRVIVEQAKRLSNPETLKNDLKAFVVNTHNEENETEIKRFYNFYIEKCDTWNGVMNIPALWNSWWSKRKTA